MFADETHVTVPCTSTARWRNGSIADYRVFIDLEPVRAIESSLSTQR
ncbi:hypothetical protein [Bradyrhizobium sp. STM 3566]